MNADHSFFGILGINCEFRFSVFFGNGKNTHRSERFEWICRLCVNHSAAHGEIINRIAERHCSQDSHQKALRENSQGNHCDLGEADGIRIYQRYDNKGVLRCNLASKELKRKERNYYCPLMPSEILQESEGRNIWRACRQCNAATRFIDCPTVMLFHASSVIVTFPITAFEGVRPM
jgi:hypothetical protein